MPLYTTAAAADASVFSPRTYGAVGDGQVVTDGAMTTGSATLACTTSLPFTAADVGKHIMVKGAGAAGVTTLVTTVSGYTDSGHVTLAAANASGGNITGALVMWATDDTSAIQSAINAAVSYAQAHGGGATVNLPPTSGQFYGIAGPLVTGGSTLGNAQLTLPVIPTTGNKVSLTIRGPVNGSGLQHWQQTVPQCSGATLVSFGVFATPTAQTTSINAGGNPALIGGPAQPGGYGIAPGNFSNMLITLENLSLLTAYSLHGLTYTAWDFSGCAEANLINFAYGTTGNVPAGDFGSPSQFATGLSIGGLMPANGNNDNCLISNLSIHGGYTYGIFATEHTVIDSARILYCWSGFCAVGTYFTSVGSTHAIKAGQLSIEGCVNELHIIGVGSAGIGPFINIDQLDTESGAPNFLDSTSGTGLAAAQGTIRMTGLYSASAISVAHPTGLRIIDGQKPYPVTAVTANYTVTVTDQTILVDATAGNVAITLISALYTPNTYTVVKTDSSAHTVTVTAAGGQTINGAATAVLSAQWSKLTVVPSGGNWVEI